MSIIYHLDIEARFCSVLGMINKFPIFQLNGENPCSFSKPINSVLIGKGNHGELIITPTDMFNPEKSTFSIKGSIKKYNREDFTGPEEGEVITRFDFERMPAGNFQFDNEEFDFSELLLRNPKATDKEKIRDYAWHLRTLLLNKNSDALLTEFQPKLIDYAICYGVPAGLLFEQFLSYLNEQIFQNKPRIEFLKEEINLVSWCDERICEIGIGLNMGEFISTEPNNDEKEYVTRVFVGLVNDELKVVR